MVETLASGLGTGDKVNDGVVLAADSADEMSASGLGTGDSSCPNLTVLAATGLKRLLQGLVLEMNKTFTNVAFARVEMSASGLGIGDQPVCPRNRECTC